MQNYPFSQDEVYNWDKFHALVKLFGFSLRVTGGVVYTHDINASSADFKALVELSS